MYTIIDRRRLLKVAGVAAAATVLGAGARAEGPATKKIVGISCSPREGKTTSEAVNTCLLAAKEAVPELSIELIDIANLNIPAYIAAGIPLKEGDKDDFPALYARLVDPNIIGIVVGSPVYFGNMSALCKAFLDRCIAFRKDNYRWKNKVAGVVAVGGTRNGGQELTIESIKTALLGQDVIAVGTGQKSVRIGASLWNQNDSIADDTFGIGTAKDLGRQVATIAMKMWS